MTQKAGIKINQLSLSFGNTPVLKNITLEIKPGEFFAFLGPSGSGKSTLLRAIAGFGPMPQGEILIGEDRITDLPPWKRHVGMVFQNYALWPHMNVFDNVAYGLVEQKINKVEIKERVEQALQLVDLSDYAARSPSQLSGGQQQRVAIARTIVVEPRVLLLDEPLSNLDANLRVQMRRDLLTLQRKLGLTTIFVTHDQEEANTITDRMAVLDHGVIQQVGSPMELYDKPANHFVAGFLGSANLIQGKIEQESEQSLFKTSSGLQFLYQPQGSKEFDQSKELTLLFRPQAIHINATPNSNHIQFEGKILHHEFLGHAIRYRISASNEIILVDSLHLRGESYLENEESVKLSIPNHEVVELTP